MFYYCSSRQSWLFIHKEQPQALTKKVVLRLNEFPGICREFLTAPGMRAELCEQLTTAAIPPTFNLPLELGLPFPQPQKSHHKDEICAKLTNSIPGSQLWREMGGEARGTSGINLPQGRDQIAPKPCRKFCSKISLRTAGREFGHQIHTKILQGIET